MAEGDFILIQTIRKLLPNKDEELQGVTKLAGFSADLVLESIAKMLNVILEPELPFPSILAPPSMAARYKRGTDLAHVCKNIGFAAFDLGYQTFLYSNERDLRAVFMFLVDKLPKEKEDHYNKDLDSRDLKRLEIQEALKNSEDKDHKIKVTKPFSAWDVDEMTDDELFKLLPKETRNAAIDAKIKLNSLIQHNEELKLGKLNGVLEREKKIDVNQTIVEPKTEIVAQADHGDNSPESIEDAVSKPKIQGSKVDALKAKKNRIQSELLALQAQYQESFEKLKQQKKALLLQNGKIGQLEAEKETKKESYEKKFQVIELLPSGQENVQRLKGIISKKKGKILAMQDQWELHKQSLVEDRDSLKSQIEALKASVKSRPKSSAMSLKETILMAQRELEEQNLKRKRLARQTQNIPSEYLDRSSYTKQIMDILSNVTKQKKETHKVMEDIRIIQKDINSVEGKLGRTYADTDYLLFEQAKKDRSLVPAYKLLVEIHKTSDDIIEIVRKTGQIRRATRSVEESANVERAKKVADKVIKLKSDLDKIRAESCALKQQKM